MTAADYAVVMFQRLLNGDDSAELLAWLRTGAAALWHSGVPLETGLRLPSTGRVLRLSARDLWLREAAKHIGGKSQSARIRALQAAAAGAACAPAVRLCMDKAISCWPLPSAFSTWVEALSDDFEDDRQMLRGVV